MYNDQTTEDKILILLDEVSDHLPIDDTKNIKEFIEHREWGVGFETLCAQIFEYNIQISNEFYKKLSAIGESMDIESFIWTPLEKLIKR